MGVALQNQSHGEKKELENAKKIMLPWIKHVVGESLVYGVDGGIKHNLLDALFKDKNSNLNRLYLSVTYSLKTFLHSIAQILEGLQGGGIDKGVFGISLQDRAKLIADNADIAPPLLPGTVNYGFNASGLPPDPLLPLPTYSSWFFQTKIKSLLSPTAIQVNKSCILKI